MTPQFLRALQAEIEATPACAQHVHTNDMPKISGAEALAKDQAIAAIINVGRTRPKAFEIGKGTIVEVLGLHCEGLPQLSQQLQHRAPVGVVRLLQVNLVRLGDRQAWKKEKKKSF